jgi:pilus assembly protein CpaC
MVASLRIVVMHNLSRLNEGLDKLVTSGDVTALSVDGAIVLTGTVADAVDAENSRRLAARFIDEEREDIINRIEITSPNQVNLRVRIAEVQRSVIKQFGFAWDAGYRGNDITFGLASGDNPLVVNNLPIEGVTDIDDASLSPAAVPFGGVLSEFTDLDSTFITRETPGVENLFAGGSFGGFDINSLVDALATDSLVTILAEPNLTAMTGQTASVLAGGEFPVPLVEADGVSVLFKEFGVSLAFTPTTISANRISMRVRPEVSQLTTVGQVVVENFIVPGLTTRRAETTVELASGQSFAIAGLFLDSSLQDIRQIPGVSNIPILGQLFDSDRFERRETELLIIVTPYMVRPVNRAIPLPTDNHMQQREVAVRKGNAAQAPYDPQTIPLNDGTPLAQNAKQRPGFIVE